MYGFACPPRGKAEACCESLCSAIGRQLSKHQACDCVPGCCWVDRRRRQVVGYDCRYLRVWEREKGRYEIDMERERVKNKKHLIKGLGDKLLEDGLQMVCSNML